MSAIDDTRKLLQDLIAPDLKALHAQLGSLEKSIDARFSAVDAKFDALDARFSAVDAKFAALEDRFSAQDAKLAALNDKLDSRFLLLNEKMDAQRESLQADNRVLAANLGLITQTLQEISSRLRRIESDRIGSPSSAPTAAA